MTAAAPALPDPSASQALLIGVSVYHRMAKKRQLPAVEANLSRLSGLLRDPRVWGLPPANCTVLHQPDSDEVVIGALRDAVKRCEDTLLVYYAGHGLTEPLIDQDLHLALPETYEPGGTQLALQYKYVRRELRLATKIPRKAVVLDCCWSGLALQATMGQDDIAQAAAIEGTAVLTASAATSTALSPPGEACTAFTGALVDMLDRGVPNGPRLLDVSTLYQHLHTRLGSAARPLPQLGVSGTGSDIVLTLNTAWRQGGTAAGTSTANGTESENGPGNGTGVGAGTAAGTGHVRADHGAAPGRPPGPHLPQTPHSPQPPPLTGEAARELVKEAVRTGRYADARALLLRAAESGDLESVGDLAADLRRERRYEEAAALERATGAAQVRDVLRGLREADRAGRAPAPVRDRTGHP